MRRKTLPSRQGVGAVRGADERTERADHVKDTGERALIEGVETDARLDYCRNDFGLQVGER